MKIRSDATLHAFAGRFENLLTGNEREFSSGQDLLESIAADLDNSKEEPHD